METMQWLTTEALSLGGSFIWNFFKNGFLYGVLGLILGIILVYLLRRSGNLKRPNKMWNLVAKLQYIFIPVLIALLLGTFAAAKSVQNTLNSWADNSASELSEYANSYLPEVKQIAEKVATSANTSEEQVRALILNNSGMADHSMAQRFYYAVNRKIIGYCLESIGLESGVDGLKQLSTPDNLARLSGMSFSGVSGYMKNGLIGTYMSGFYWSLAIFFFPFLLLSLGEFVLFLINKKTAPIVKNGFVDMQEKYSKKNKNQ